MDIPYKSDDMFELLKWLDIGHIDDKSTKNAEIYSYFDLSINIRFTYNVALQYSCNDKIINIVLFTNKCDSASFNFYELYIMKYDN
jgi:hypothetical protein